MNSAYGPNERLCAQPIEQRFRIFQIGGVEALGEPVVDFGEHSARFVAALLTSQQARETHGGAQLPPFGLLMRRDFDCLAKARFSFIFYTLSGVTVLHEQQIASAIDALEAGRAAAKLADFEIESPQNPPTVSRPLDQPALYDFRKVFELIRESLERVNGFEPSTLCLASTRSTN